MIRTAKLLCLVLLISGCSANALLVPLVGIPSTNYLTLSHYEEKYQLYDEKYRESVNFIEHRIPREGYTIYAREFGAQKNNIKPVIILLHGFPDSLHIYDRLAPLLADHYRVVSFDFLGWGKSDKPENHTYNSKSLYQDLDTVIRYFNIEHVSIVVHDASGPPGINWALDNPRKMEVLILLNTYFHRAPGLVPPEAIATFSTPGIKRTIIRTGAKLSNFGWKTGYQNQLGKFFHDEEQRNIMVPVLTYQALDIRNAFFQLNDFLNEEIRIRSESKWRLSEYKGNVKIIFGNEDPYLNRKVAKNFNEIFPVSSLYLIDQAAHFVQLDKPE
ncbi:MAG: alpha/beta hydrolase [Gammaproteobacteria bacterium]|nr:alpha/beta hydrolase [Gammaproteobacteria bacterium]